MFTHIPFNTDAFAHSRVDTEAFFPTELFRRGALFAHMTGFHTATFANRHFYTQRCKGAYTGGCIYTETLSHTDTVSHSNFYTKVHVR